MWEKNVKIWRKDKEHVNVFIWHRVRSSGGLLFTVADLQVACDVLPEYFSVANFPSKSLSCTNRICITHHRLCNSWDSYRSTDKGSNYLWRSAVLTGEWLPTFRGNFCFHLEGKAAIEDSEDEGAKFNRNSSKYSSSRHGLTFEKTGIHMWQATYAENLADRVTVADDVSWVV
jgi:hypothetical protein